MTLKLNGSSSGYTTLDAPASGGNRAITFPDAAGVVALTSTAGKLLQLQVATNQTTNQTPSGNTTWTQVGPTVTITPTAATSKILVCVNAWAIVKNIGEFSHNIYRTIGGSEGDLQQWWGEAADDNWMPMNMHALIVDSPNTTSEISYKTRIYCTSNNGDFRWNYDGGADPTASLIAIEVGA